MYTIVFVSHFCYNYQYKKEWIRLKLIKVSGGMEIPNEMTMDEFIDIFLELIESKGQYFGGGFEEITDSLK